MVTKDRPLARNDVEAKNPETKQITTATTAEDYVYWHMFITFAVPSGHSWV